MTLDDLRRLAGPGPRRPRIAWLARVLGVHVRGLRDWLDDAAPTTPSATAADWLDRLHAITPAPTPRRPHRVLIDVDAPPGAERRA